MKKYLLLSLLLLLSVLSSCRTQYVAMPEIHTLDHHATDLRIDSTYIDRYHIERDLPSPSGEGPGVRLVHDSIDRWHYIFSGTTDTIRQHDSIPYPVEVPVEVPAPIPRFYKNCTIGFFLLLLAIIAYIALRMAHRLGR